MDFLLITARLVHIVLGAFWVGTMVFNAFFLGPSVRDAGPDGAKVMGALMRRRFMDVMPAVAGLTILSGLWLYWKMSNGFQSAYLHSAGGMTFALGGLLAITAFGLGLAVVRPAMLGAMALGQAAAQAPAAEREMKLASAQALRTRAAGAGRLVAVLLLLAVAAMAVGRYI